MHKEMVVAGMAVDPVTKSPIVVLRDRENQCALPIWIGALEAHAIAMVLEGVLLPRPMTHDLLKSVLDTTGARLRKVEITDIRENTYYAALHLEKGGGTVLLDSRPSDAIALALRCDAPIVVAEQVLAKALILEEGEPASAGKDRWTELLEKMDPEQFSKYKM